MTEESQRSIYQALKRKAEIKVPDYPEPAESKKPTRPRITFAPSDEDTQEPSVSAQSWTEPKMPGKHDRESGGPGDVRVIQYLTEKNKADMSL